MMRAVLVTLVAAVVVGQDSLPFLDTVPVTSFTCEGRSYGYYADLEANCQVFHICYNNIKWSFLCPNQTIFNQEYFVCDYSVNVDCEVAASLYALNDNFGKVVEEDEKQEEEKETVTESQ